jgi:hypothetical protein
VAEKERGGGFNEPPIGEQPNQSLVGKLACLLQAIDGLVGPKKAVRPSGLPIGFGEGDKVQTGENLGRILVKEDFEEGGVGVWGAKVKVGQVDCAKVGIFGDGGVKKTVDEGVGSDGSGDRASDRQPITTRCSSYPAINVGHDVPKLAGTKKSEGEPLLLQHVIKIRWKGSGGVNRSQSA